MCETNKTYATYLARLAQETETKAKAKLVRIQEAEANSKIHSLKGLAKLRLLVDSNEGSLSLASEEHCI